MLNVEKCKILAGRKVALFPDLADSARERWEIISQEINHRFGAKSIASDYLSKINDGSDIADYLIKLPVEQKRVDEVQLKEFESTKHDVLAFEILESVDLLSKYISKLRPAIITGSEEPPF